MNRNKSDLYISQAMGIQIGLMGIKNILNQGIYWFYINNSKLNVFISLIILIFYCRAFLTVYNYSKMNKINFGIVFIILQTFLFTFVLYPENIDYISVWLTYAIYYCYIPFFLISKLKSLKYLDYYMCLVAKFLIVASIISSVYIYLNGGIMTTNSKYSMALSYPVLSAVMWLIYENYLKKYSNSNKVLNRILIVLGIIVMCVYGSRNPILAVVSYVTLILIIKFMKQKYFFKRMYYLIVIYILLIFGLFYKILLKQIVVLLGYVNIQSRSLELLAIKSLASSGRNVIHSILVNTLNKNILVGYGVSGDEVILSRYGMTQSAHSLYLSLFSTYGYIIGTIILVMLILLNILAYRKAKGNNRYILLLYMCLVWPRGFTGGDIWNNPVFWWLLGICSVILNKCVEQKR